MTVRAYLSWFFAKLHMRLLAFVAAPLLYQSVCLDHAQASAFDKSTLWPKGTVLRVCFMDSAPKDKRIFVRDTALEWLQAGADISLDFGKTPVPPICSSESNYEVRVKISEELGGRSESYIGINSKLYSEAPSMILSNIYVDRPNSRKIVLLLLISPA